MVSHREFLLSIFFSIIIIEGSMASIFDGLTGLQGLPGFSGSNGDPASSPSELWPSFVRIVDVADLPSVLFNNVNTTNRHSSGSLWSNIFNIFTDGSEGTINDELERENGAWFAIPGWNKASINGSGLSHTLLPGLLVPAKFDPSQLNTTHLNSMLHVPNMFPLGFLFNHSSSMNSLNPFNLPFLPNTNEMNLLNVFKPNPVIPEKTTSGAESVEIKPLPPTYDDTKAKETRRIHKIRSILKRALDMENEGENYDTKKNEKVVNIIEPVEETGMQMEGNSPVDTEMSENSSSGPEKPRSFGLLSSLVSLLASSSPLNNLVKDPLTLGTLHEPNNAPKGQDHSFVNMNI